MAAPKRARPVAVAEPAGVRGSHWSIDPASGERVVHMHQPFNHANESARAARTCHAAMMHPDHAFEAFYLHFKPYRLQALPDSVDASGWTLAINERIPGHLSVEGLIAWFAARAGRIPYLIDDGRVPYVDEAP